MILAAGAKTAAKGATGWIGPAIGAITGGLGMIGQKKREKRAMANQRKLMSDQAAHQASLNKLAHDLQFEMWEKTNYPAQVKMLEEAGLNPANIYGQSGAPGTTGSVGGGSAAGGQAPAPQPVLMGEMIKAALAKSQIKLSESQAEKNEAEAESIRGEEGTIGASQVKANLAEALNKESMAQLNRLGYEIGFETKGDQIDKAFYEVEFLAQQKDLTEAQTELAKEKVATEGIQRQLMRANIKLSEQQAQKLVSDIKQGWQKLDNELQSLGLQNQANKLRAVEGKTDLAKIQANFALGVLGKEIDLMKLNLEQQKIFVSIMGNVMGMAPTKTKKVEATNEGKVKETQQTTSKY